MFTDGNGWFKTPGFFDGGQKSRLSQMRDRKAERDADGTTTDAEGELIKRVLGDPVLHDRARHTRRRGLQHWFLRTPKYEKDVWQKNEGGWEP